jgi:hypothetical protein
VKVNRLLLHLCHEAADTLLLALYENRSALKPASNDTLAGVTHLKIRAGLYREHFEPLHQVNKK